MAKKILHLLKIILDNGLVGPMYELGFRSVCYRRRDVKDGLLSRWYIGR